MQFKDLPFVKADGDKIISAWSPETPTGYGHGCELGREYFQALCGIVSEAAPKSIYLVRALQGIVAGGVMGSVEIGFLQAVAEAAFL